MNRTFDPFARPVRRRPLPREMAEAPALDCGAAPAPIERYTALLVNPFYPKDPYASFGKHVLTPTLALTSFAATTPAPWRVRYWDENLLDGRPPSDPLPEVVGISVAPNGFAIHSDPGMPGNTNSTIGQFSEDLSLIRGPHQIGFGVNYIKSILNNKKSSPARPRATFNADGTGLAMADFLVGRLSAYSSR